MPLKPLPSPEGYVPSVPVRVMRAVGVTLGVSRSTLHPTLWLMGTFHRQAHLPSFRLVKCHRHLSGGLGGQGLATRKMACACSQAPPMLGNLVWPLRGWVVPREQTRRPSGRELGGQTGQASAVSRRWVAGW